MSSRRITAATVPAGYIPVSEALVLRALEIAGKRMLGRTRHKHPGLDPWQYHTVAPETTQPAEQVTEGILAGPVDVVAASLGVDADAWKADLAGYVNELIRSHQPHTSARLRSWILGGPDG